MTNPNPTERSSRSEIFGKLKLLAALLLFAAIIGAFAAFFSRKTAPGPTNMAITPARAPNDIPLPPIPAPSTVFPPVVPPQARTGAEVLPTTRQNPDVMQALPAEEKPPNTIKNPTLYTPTEAQMLGVIVGAVESISADSIVIRTEWPDAETGIRVIVRTVTVPAGTKVTIMGQPKSPEVFKAEQAGYEQKVKAGTAAGLEPPFPSDTKEGSLNDLAVGMHVTVRTQTPAEPLVAADITVPLPPLAPGAAQVPTQ